VPSKPPNLAEAAQDAAAQRLEDATVVALYEEGGDDEITHEQYEFAAGQLVAPYCGCVVCVVREVIDAAWPYLSVLAIEQYHEAMEDPEVRAQLESLRIKVREAATLREPTDD
jgi:hypothetical protein